MKPSPRIAIIGAGFGGLALGVNLRKAEIDSFTIFEKSDGPGGTWWDNTYPGAACDISAALYSCSFMPWDWSGTHPPQEEILTYIKALIERFDLSRHIRCSTAVEEVTWDERTHSHTVRTADGDTRTFDVVVSAVGMLNVPNASSWPGLETFAGPTFHTARWEHQHDLAGKRVAVVGTGSTTAQLAPAIAPLVGRLTIFQREAGWVVPKAERRYDEAERARLRRSSFSRRRERAKVFFDVDKRRAAADPSGEAQAQFRSLCLKILQDKIPDPDLRAKVTPRHLPICKRPIISNSYLPTLARPNVELVASPVTRVTPSGVVDASGTEHPADVLVLATGFRAADYLATFKVTGCGGKTLRETWNGEPTALLGLAMPGFPNFYMMYGPGTNGGSILFKLECQAEWITGVVKRMRRTGETAIEARADVYQRYNRWMDRENAKMAWNGGGGCNNYFAAASGRVVTQFPGSQAMYWALTRAPSRLVTTSRRRPARERTPSARLAVAAPSEAWA